MWAFARRHSTVHGRRYTVSSYAGLRGWARLYTILWLPSFFDAVFVAPFPFVCRGVACNILVLVLTLGALSGGVRLPPCLYLALLAAAPAYLLLPFAPYASGRAGLGMFSRLHPLVGYTPLLTRLSLCFSLRGVARHVTYLYWCLCLCARLSPFLSLHTMLLVRGGGGCVVLAGACLYRHTAFPMCAACGGGHGPSWWRRLRVLVLRATVGLCVCGHTFPSLCCRVRVGMALGCTPLVTFVRCM